MRMEATVIKVLIVETRDKIWISYSDLQSNFKHDLLKR